MSKKDLLKQQIELANEGLVLSRRYSTSDLPNHLREEGKEQKHYYYTLLKKLLTELYRVNH